MPPKRTTPTLDEFAAVFWQHIRVDEATGCWLWTGYVDGGGYGNVIVRGFFRTAHRISWELHHGPIPDGLWVLHHCDVKLCVHALRCLFLGTPKDNVWDSKLKGRSYFGERTQGEKNPLVKLKETEVIAIWEACRDGEPIRGQARDYGVTQGTVHDIIRGRTWRYLQLPPLDPRPTPKRPRQRDKGAVLRLPRTVGN